MVAAGRHPGRCSALLVYAAAAAGPDVDRVLGILIVQTVMPLVALVLGTAALGSEIEDGTAVYLLASRSRAGRSRWPRSSSRSA